MVQRIPMSLTGNQQLRDELDRLERVERHEIVKAIEVARAHGDLSENAEYHAAKERQSLVEGRILELKDKLGRAEIIDWSKVPIERAVFGTVVQQPRDVLACELVGGGGGVVEGRVDDGVVKSGVSHGGRR